MSISIYSVVVRDCAGLITWQIVCSSPRSMTSLAPVAEYVSSTRPEFPLVERTSSFTREVLVTTKVCVCHFSILSILWPCCLLLWFIDIIGRTICGLSRTISCFPALEACMSPGTMRVSPLDEVFRLGSGLVLWVLCPKYSVFSNRNLPSIFGGGQLRAIAIAYNV